MEGDLPFSLINQGASDFLKCGQTTSSEPPSEPARRPLLMSIFSLIMPSRAGPKSRPGYGLSVDTPPESSCLNATASTSCNQHQNPTPAPHIHSESPKCHSRICPVGIYAVACTNSHAYWATSSNAQRSGVPNSREKAGWITRRHYTAVES